MKPNSTWLVFPMVPFVNRVASGRLQLAGTPLKAAVVNPGERVAIAIQFEIGAS
jgi:galactose mutarotase-like enzyme